MDKTLQDLKRAREETEGRFRTLVDESLRALESLEQSFSALAKGATPGRHCLEIIEGCLGVLRRLLEGLQEMAALDNARSAELARQVTVLPAARVDLILEEFDKRLEALECRIQRLEKARQG